MQLSLISKTQEVTSSVFSFVFKPPSPVSWKAGQFMKYNLSNPNPDERGTNRFFTIASAPFEKNLIITTRFSDEIGSSFKDDLKKLAVGQTIEAEGPFGSFVIDDPQKECVFIAGGIGITPFRSILLDLDHNSLPINVTLLYANRDQNIVFKDLFNELAMKHSSFNVHYIIDPQRIDEQTIRQTINHGQSSSSNNPSAIYNVSGPAPMVKAVEETLENMGVEADFIIHDYFPGYEKI